MRRAFFIVAIAITALGVMGQSRPLVTVFDIGAGVRPVSLGEAFTGLADDEYALFYNPAGLATLTGAEPRACGARLRESTGLSVRRRC